MNILDASTIVGGTAPASVMSADMTLAVTHAGGAIAISSGVLTLPASPGIAQNTWVKGNTLELACTADVLLLAQGGGRFTVPGGDALILTGSPAVAFLSYLGNQWVVSEY